ncbi:MAG: 4-hydroxythreonine-4-phosphate dehydrogenase PdxA [Gammaproteobacteria bacterium WSBS_2016_MAG_OTU1]
MQDKKPIVITAGDPAGIGPDLCLDALNGDCKSAIVVIGDINVLRQRAQMLNVPFTATEYTTNTVAHRAILHCPTTATVVAGQLSPDNATHVLQQLNLATDGCINGEFGAMLTAPLSKQTISAAGFNFCGQTEYIAARAAVAYPVMLLAGDTIRVSILTRHIPLAQVASAISQEDIVLTLQILDTGLRQYFTNGRVPRIAVAGLNPHAGEGGYIGDEEQRIIAPAIAAAVATGVQAEGPLSADTMFRFTEADCFLAMYHDQGLPAIKILDFDNAINTTLGLPFLRVSPDHGTAAHLAGSGNISPNSMRAALALAAT